MRRVLRPRSCLLSPARTSPIDCRCPLPSIANSSPSWLLFAPALTSVPTLASNFPGRRFSTVSATVAAEEHATRQHDEPTIYALSTPAGKSAIAVVRISGPACMSVYGALCPSRTPPRPRVATLRTLYHPSTKKPLDPGALILFFPANASVTGEDVLELHVHGGPAIIRAVLSAIPLCGERGQIVPAEAGEFTKRAFYNDRLSLPQVEALGDTLSATTEMQRSLAVRGSSTVLSEKYERWRKQLISARGELEAIIDFSEDQSFSTESAEILSETVSGVQTLRGQLELHLRNAVRGELLRNGISLSLVGAPNAGKSSLLNRIVGREAVIVSEEAGTTRDVIDLAVDIGGFMVVLGDTAGLRIDEVVGRIEAEGIRRAKKRVLEADVVVGVVDVELLDQCAPTLRIEPEVMSTLALAAEAAKPVLIAVNKIDLLPERKLPDELLETLRLQFSSVPQLKVFPISCAASSGQDDGIPDFLHGLTSMFTEMTAVEGAGEESIGATERQRVLVQECLESLDDFLRMVGTTAAKERVYDEDDEVDVVLAAEALRAAADCLSRVTGKGEAGDVEEVLGVVFERFCVGK